ncbi:MAG: formylglycine-generating enzyme family protein [Deltaproteobacteria bacterium]|nr:formylglycine-generating enzyme family protein [Deltaproteobacteria bacterium]
MERPGGGCGVVALDHLAVTTLAMLAVSACEGVREPVFLSLDSGSGRDAAGLQWVLVPAGEFTMGSPPDEPCRGNDEQSHLVRLTRAFELASIETTRRDFSALMGYVPPPAGTCGDSCPVTGVTWHEAAAFCNALSAARGLEACYTCDAGTCRPTSAAEGAGIYGCAGFRLPTEAEWERACRAGGQAALYTGAIGSCEGADPAVDALAWYDKNAQGGVHAAAEKQSNAWGLYDMAGNAWEWCHDGYQPDLGAELAVDPWGAPSSAVGVGRGGAWDEASGHSRAAFRNPTERGFTDESAGFRCARTR